MNIKRLVCKLLGGHNYDRVSHWQGSAKLCGQSYFIECTTCGDRVAFKNCNHLCCEIMIDAHEEKGGEVTR